MPESTITVVAMLYSNVVARELPVSVSDLQYKRISSYSWDKTTCGKDNDRMFIPGYPRVLKEPETDTIQLMEELAPPEHHNYQENISNVKKRTEATFRSLEVCGELENVLCTMNVITGRILI